MKKSESIGELAKSLAKFQGEVKQPLKDKNNPFFKSKYVPLENVVDAINSVAPKHGLSYIQYPLNQDNKVGVITILMHESGEWIETEPIFTTPAKQDAQSTGSVITYLKRYSLSAVFGITSDEDDDGNAGTGPKANNNNENPQPQQPRQQNNLASDKQHKLIAEKITIISQKTKKQPGMVYGEAMTKAKLNPNLQSSLLTAQQASALIGELIIMEAQ